MEYLKNQQTTKTGQSQKILSWEQGFGSWLKLFSDSNGRREFGYNVRYCVFLTFVNVFKYFPTQVAAGGSALCSLHCSLLCIDAVRKMILCSALLVYSVQCTYTRSALNSTIYIALHCNTNPPRGPIGAYEQSQSCHSLIKKTNLWPIFIVGSDLGHASTSYERDKGPNVGGQWKHFTTVVECCIFSWYAR